MSGESHEGELPNIPLPTAGGKQLWRDTWWREGWRVQTHVWTGHNRLLDAGDVRRAWGSEAACLARGKELAPPSPERGELVVLIHGFLRSDASLDGLAKKLTERGFATCVVGYPSTQGDIAEQAAGLDTLLCRLDPPPARLSFVTHSMGGIVARALATEQAAWRKRSKPGRLVQLAPPNGGAAIARFMNKVPGVNLLAGPALADLGEARDYPTPSLEIGVIAASKGTDGGHNPLILGDDDGVVSVDETRLDEPHEHVQVDGLHTFLMNQIEVLELVDRFLRSGRFEL